MQKQILIAAFAAALLGLAGCQSAPATKADAKPEISAEAKAALAQAEKDVKAASAAGALWTTADKALKDAQKAAKEGKSADVIKNAKEASEDAKLGLEQRKMPLMTLSK